MKNLLKSWLPAVAALLMFSGQAYAGNIFDITLNFGGGLTSSQEAIFSSAEATWESIITGYVGGANPLAGETLIINASGEDIDGSGGILGSAGPSGALFDTGFYYTNGGSMRFDTADLAALESSGRLLDVILHEMAHVIGFGTMWDPYSDYGLGGGQDVYDESDFEFTGAHALAAYQAEFTQPGATAIPIEQGGGSGTAGGHWNENDGGAGQIGITSNITGKDLAHELMTGWLNTPTFISDMTKASFIDIGYLVNLDLEELPAVPEPSTFALAAVGLLCVGVARRKRK